MDLRTKKGASEGRYRRKAGQTTKRLACFVAPSRIELLSKV